MSRGRHLIGSPVVIALLPTVSMAASLPGDLTVEPYEFRASNGEMVHAEMGTLIVAYDRSTSESETIALKFVRFPATTETPGPPLVYLAGGPGGSGIAAARGVRFELFMKLRELGDVRRSGRAGSW